MTRKYTLRSMLMALLLLSYGPVMGQVAATGEKQKLAIELEQKVALADGTFKLLWSKLNVDFRRVVTGAPYSAIAVSEHTQTLSDGNQIIRKSTSTYYRDSEGRIRTERRLDNIGNWTASATAPELIMIADPVAGRSYTLNPDNRTARVDPYAISSAVAKEKNELEIKMAAKPMAPKSATKAMAPKLATKAMPPELAAQVAKKAGATPDFEASSKEPFGERMKKESLGRQVIEGVEVEGTRTTQTIPAGEIGNTLPIQIVDESWYSPELQLRVMIVHRDPRSGESTFRLTNINRSEPGKTLFEVPSDYWLVESSENRPKKGVPG